MVICIYNNGKCLGSGSVLAETVCPLSSYGFGACRQPVVLTVTAETEQSSFSRPLHWWTYGLCCRV